MVVEGVGGSTWFFFFFVTEEALGLCQPRILISTFFFFLSFFLNYLISLLMTKLFNLFLIQKLHVASIEWSHGC